MKMKLAVAGLFAFVLGCSTQQGEAEKVPPIINEGSVKAFSVREGVFKPQLISVLVWPTSWTEKETEQKVFTINSKSKELDSLMVEAATSGPKIEALFTQFQSTNCIAEFRKPGTSDKDPEEYEEIETVEWVDAKDIDFIKVVALKSCVENQAERQKLRNRLSSIQSTLVPEISQIIDDALGAENKVSVGRDSSEVSIKTAEDGSRKIKVVLQAFNGADINQSSEEGEGQIKDVKLSMDDTRLQFTVPDLKSEGVEYEFDLFRVDDLLPPYTVKKRGKLFPVNMAKFKGDLIQKKNGVVTRKGSAQMLGELTSTTPLPK